MLTKGYEPNMILNSTRKGDYRTQKTNFKVFKDSFLISNTFQRLLSNFYLITISLALLCNRFKQKGAAIELPLSLIALKLSV